MSVAFGVCWHSFIFGFHWDPDERELTIYPFPTLAIYFKLKKEGAK